MTLLPIWQSNLQLKFSEMQPIMQCSRAENVGPGARLDLGSREARSGPSSVRIFGLQQTPVVIAEWALDRAFAISLTGECATGRRAAFAKAKLAAHGVTSAAGF
jgi:hypothetical protein